MLDRKARAASLFHRISLSDEQAKDALIQALSDQDALVRHVAAIELAQLAPSRLPESSIRELLDTLGRLEYFEKLAIEEEYFEVTATENDFLTLDQQIVVAFCALNCGQADYVVARLLEFWSFDSQFYELGRALLALTFPSSNLPIRREELNNRQYRVLQALVAETEIWTSDATWPRTLAKHGLPQNRGSVRELLKYRQWKSSDC